MTDATNREALIEEAAKAMWTVNRPPSLNEDQWDATWGTSKPAYTALARAALAVFEQAHAKPVDTSPEPVKIGADSSHVTPTDDELEAVLRLGFRRSEPASDDERVSEIASTLRPTPSDRDGTARAKALLDDEREALRIAELDARQAAYRQDCTDWFLDHEHSPEVATNTFFRGWDAAVAAGFRRSEVPEPSAARPICDACGVPFHLIQHDEGCDAREPQGEPSCRHEACEIDSAGNSTRCADCGATEGLPEVPEPSAYDHWTLKDHVRRAVMVGLGLTRPPQAGEPFDATMMVEQVLASLAETNAPEPQGEPSDAAVEAGVYGFIMSGFFEAEGNGAPGRALMDGIRAALRAAGECSAAFRAAARVEQEGENHG